MLPYEDGLILFYSCGDISGWALCLPLRLGSIPSGTGGSLDPPRRHEHYVPGEWPTDSVPTVEASAPEAPADFATADPAPTTPVQTDEAPRDPYSVV